MVPRVISDFPLRDGSGVPLCRSLRSARQRPEYGGGGHVNPQRSRCSTRFPAAFALVVLLTAALVPIVTRPSPAQASPTRSGAIVTITGKGGSYFPGQSPAVILSDVSQTATLTWLSGNSHTNIPVAWTAKLLDSESPVAAGSAAARCAGNV